MLTAKVIEHWFETHDDGEFVRHGRAAPYVVIGPAAGRSSIVFTTKPNALLSVFGQEELPPGFAMVGRYGLPLNADARWIAEIATSRILFLGDLDPPDLLIFAWLRERLRGKPPTFIGISDQFLRAISVAPSKPPTLQMTHSEEACVAVLERTLPDLGTLVGETCLKYLLCGKKLELEGVLSASKGPGKSIVNLVDSLKNRTRKRG